MAVPAKDGSMHHSAGRASLHDSMTSKGEKSSGKSVAPMKKPAGQHEAGGEGKAHPAIPQDHPHMAGPHQTPTETPIQEHVEEHGPATHVMHAEHEGSHHVTSHHGGMGKNMHHSVHESAEAAHEHMGTAMGGESADENESPDAAAENEGAEEPSNMSSSIPGLA